MAEDPELEDPVDEHSPPARLGELPPQARLGGLRRRGIYLLPNLFTTGVLFCGFFAIVQAMERSERLNRLQRRVCRPLDRPLIPKVKAADLAAYDDEIDLSADEIEADESDEADSGEV